MPLIGILPFLVAGYLYAIWAIEGASSTAAKALVFVLIAASAYLQFASAYPTTGLLLNSAIAIVLLICNRWQAAQRW